MPKKNDTPTNQPDTHTHDHTHEHTHDDAQGMIAPNTVLELTLKWSEVEPVYKTVLTTLSKRVKSPGFRKGKVPPQVAESIIGQETLREETAKKLLPAAYETLIKDSKKQPLSQPEFQAKKIDLNADWEFNVIIAEKPTLELKDYKKVIKQAKDEAKKTFEKEQKEKKAKKDDKTQTATTTPQQPELNEKDVQLQAAFRTMMLTYKPQVPELLVKQETRFELEEFVQSLDQVNVGLDEYLQRRQMTFDQLTNEIATQALSRLQLDFLYSALIEDQKMTVTEADLDEFTAKITDEKEREKRRKDPEYIRYITPMILRQKVSEYLLSL